jgi:hypothetical protein
MGSQLGYVHNPHGMKYMNTVSIKAIGSDN